MASKPRGTFGSHTFPADVSGLVANVRGSSRFSRCGSSCSARKSASSSSGTETSRIPAQTSVGSPAKMRRTKLSRPIGSSRNRRPSSNGSSAQTSRRRAAFFRRRTRDLAVSIKRLLLCETSSEDSIASNTAASAIFVLPPSKSATLKAVSSALRTMFIVVNQSPFCTGWSYVRLQKSYSLLRGPAQFRSVYQFGFCLSGLVAYRDRRGHGFLDERRLISRLAPVTKLFSCDLHLRLPCSSCSS